MSVTLKVLVNIEEIKRLRSIEEKWNALKHRDNQNQLLTPGKGRCSETSSDQTVEDCSEEETFDKDSNNIATSPLNYFKQVKHFSDNKI